MFRLKVSDTVVVPVSGSIPGEDGRAQPFAFTLRCKRLTAAAIKAELDNDERTVADFLASVIEGWAGVADADGMELPFSRAALDELLAIVGMAGVCFTAYLSAVGAKGKAKN